MMQIKTILTCSLVILWSCQPATDTEMASQPATYTPSELKWELTGEQRQWVESTLNAMSPEQKIGQLLAPAVGPGGGSNNKEIADQVAEWIKKYHIGHVYVASSKMDPVSTAGLINEFQLSAQIPLLIHSDFENGTGSKFDGGTIFPPLMGIAQTGSEQAAYQMASVIATEARALGVHLINSPVLDVNINPDNPGICTRAFSDRPETVASFGQKFLRGLSEHGLIGAAKHFPGLGPATVDSHSKLPTIEGPRERLDSIEFYPYNQVMPRLFGMMTAHISVPVLDPTPNLPATLSKPILTDVFQNEMGFKGIMITDAFDMSALLDFGSFEESALKSLLAGNDVVLLWTEPKFELVFPYMLEAVASGRLSQERLEKSVRTVLEMKARLGLNESKIVDIDRVKEVVGSEQHNLVAENVYHQSLVLVKNEDNTLPLDTDTEQKIAVIAINDDLNHPDIGEIFIEQIKLRAEISQEFMIDPETPDTELTAIQQKLSQADIVVAGVFARVFARRGSAELMHDSILEFMQNLSVGSIPVVAVNFGSPYMIRQYPEVHAYLVATEPSWDFYGYAEHRPGQLAAARALFGEVEVSGRLAVSIPGLYPFGHGLNYNTP